jgi:hypothetical protein
MKTRRTAKLPGSKSAALFSFAAGAGIVATAALAVNAERKAYNITSDQGITTEEKIKNTWGFYRPAGVAALATAACLIQANRIRNRVVISVYFALPAISEIPGN